MKKKRIGQLLILVGNILIMVLTIGYVYMYMNDATGMTVNPAVIVLIAFVLMAVMDMVYCVKLKRELQKSIIEVEKANMAKTSFLSSMSHDIRTPLNAIVGMTAIAEKNINDSVYVEECLQKIKLASKHLQTLVNDILDISQIESGKFALNPVKFSLAESAKDLVNLIYPNALKKGITCNVYLTHINQEYLYADKLRLNQIWLNLLTNAIKYTPSGGRVDVYLREEDIPGKDELVRLVLQIADTGIGMSEEYIKKVFEPFTRENDRQIENTTGSGLGMAVAKQMVDLLGGTIDVKSKKGQGTAFTVTLELRRADDAINCNTDSRKKILLVGEENLTDSIKAYLDGMNIQTFCVKTQEEVREYIRNNTCDIVIIDRKMNDTICLDMAELIHSYYGDLSPEIIISAYESSDIETKASDFGVTGFIDKPVFKTTLCEFLRQYDVKEEKEENLFHNKSETDKFKGKKVLIAEDNDLNWEIINELLSSYGIISDRAENGRECIRRLQMDAGNEYIMIFMDIQMPELNGYETARLIREMKDNHKSRIPIVAMTADAFAKDVQNCKEAGMNGHISKPVNINMVLEEINKYI